MDSRQPTGTIESAGRDSAWEATQAYRRDCALARAAALDPADRSEDADWWRGVATAIREGHEVVIERWDLDDEDLTDQDWQEVIRDFRDEADGLQQRAAEEQDPDTAASMSAEVEYLGEQAASAEGKLAELRSKHDTAEF